MRKSLPAQNLSKLLGKAIPFICLGVIGGVFFTSLFDIFIILIFFVAICCFLIVAKKESFLVATFCLGFFLGFVFLQNENSKIEASFPDEFEGRAIVSAQPSEKQSYQSVTLEVEGDEREKELKFITFQPIWYDFEKGQQVEVSCSLERPQNKHENFDYVRYLAKDGIYRVCSGEIRKAEKAGDQKISFALVSRKIEKQIKKILPSPESDYLAGLLLGGSDRLPKNVAEAFRRTGTTHTVAVSGYNITIVAAVVMAFFLFLGMWRRQAFWLAVLGIVCFVLLVGSPSSAVRAAIMSILVLWAARNGRLASSGRALLLAGAGMILFSPLILVYDVGFQLSFLATIGIVYIYGPLSQRFRIKDDFLELKSIVLVTLSAQIAVTGIIIYQFETFSPISLLANFVILPFVPLIMLLGFVSIFVSFLIPILGKILAVATWLLLHLEIEAIELFSKISFASIEVSDIGKVWLVLYYIFVLGLIFHLQNKRKIKNDK